MIFQGTVGLVGPNSVNDVQSLTIYGLTTEIANDGYNNILIKGLFDNSYGAMATAQMTRPTLPGSTVRFTMGNFVKPEIEACEDFVFTSWVNVGVAINSVYSHYRIDSYEGIIFTVTSSDLEDGTTVNNDPCVLRAVEPQGSKYTLRDNTSDQSDYAELDLQNQGF